MKLHRFAITAIFLATATSMIGAVGCASNPDATGDASSDDESALSSRAWEDLVDAYDATSGPDFQQIVFTRSIEAKGHHFFANVDNGIRCITAPCPSTDRIEGWYTAGPKTVTLHLTAPGTSGDLEGRYRYTLPAKGGLTMTRSGATHVFSSVGTYCDEVEDCGEQSYVHIMCVGHATCGATHSCGYTCGFPLPDGGADAGDAGKSDAGTDAGVACGTSTCAVGDVCCNPVMSICTKPGMFCIQ